MVSESPFSEPTILSEQKTASSFLGPDKSFKIPVHSFVKMAQVDNLTERNINHSEKIINSNSIANDIDDSEGINSDIDLSIEESDDKEVICEAEDATVRQKSKTFLNKDTESLESLDNDLANTAHLVGTGFSADEFDQIDCLDAIDHSTNGVKSNNIPKLVPRSTELDDRGKSSDSNKTYVSTSINGDRTQTNDVNDKNEERSGNEQLLNESPVKVERNNNKTERIFENEKPTGEQGTKVKFEPGICQRNDPVKITPKPEAFDEDSSDEFRLEIDSCSDDQSQDSVSRQPLSLESNSENIPRSQNDNSRKVKELHTQSEEISSKSTVPVKGCSKEDEPASVRTDKDSSKLTEKMSTLVENDASKQIDLDKKSTSNVISMKNTDKPDDYNTNFSKIVEPVRCQKSTSELTSIENCLSDSETSSGIRSVNQNSNQAENMSIDDDLPLDDISATDVGKSDDNYSNVVKKNISNQYEKMSIDIPSKIILNEDISNSSETRSASVLEDIPDSIRSAVAENQDLESSEDEVSPQNDDLRSDLNFQEAQAVDSPDVILSPMIVDDDKEPKSVESNDIIIDSVESEIIELDADDEPVILDDDLGDVSPSDSRSSLQKFNQLLENTAKEVTNDDIEAEVVVGNDDPVPSTSGVANDEYKKVEISLNRLMPNDTDSRKRRLQPNQDDSLFVEKRARISESDSSDRCNSTNSTEHRKKPLANRARKHTSSTNVDKTFEEIQKKIRDGVNKQNRNQESSTGQDLSDSYDCEIHDNDGDINDANCSETVQNADNNAHKIQLNYDVISKENLKNIFKVMRTKLTRRQLETMMVQKCCEMISDSNEIGTLRRQVAELQQAEQFRKQKINNLEKQILQLKAVCQRYLDQVKENADKIINPIKITRSVGLQVAFGDSSPFVNIEPTPTTPRNQDKLKKLLSAPPINNRRSLTVSESQQNVTKSNSASPLPSNINPRNYDARLVNGDSRISSPLSSCGSPTPNSSPSAAGNSRNNLKVTKSVDEDAPVIDLTDKDDKNENEGNVAAKNLLATVNGAVVTYVPVKVNSQDQNRQVIKPGASILVNGQLMTIQSTSKFPPAQHPAPVPAPPQNMTMVPGAKPLPPKPILKIERSDAGIMLSWEFPRNTIYADISKYQLFAYQETESPARSDLWKAVGDVSALPLPMACTLTQFVVGFKYHFIVRAVDIHNRYGPFSIPRTITL